MPKPKTVTVSVRMTEAERAALTEYRELMGLPSNNEAARYLARNAFKLTALVGSALRSLCQLADADRSIAVALVNLVEAGEGQQAEGLLNLLESRIRGKEVKAGLSELQAEQLEAAAIFQTLLLAEVPWLSEADRRQVMANLERRDWQRLAADAKHTLHHLIFERGKAANPNAGNVVDMASERAYRLSEAEWAKPSDKQATIEAEGQDAAP